MRILAVSSTPISADRVQRAGCQIVGNTAAGDMFVTVLACDDPEHGLTTRQMEVLRLSIAGHGVAAVASLLGVSRKTVERHLRHCRQRLSAANDVQLGALAERLGF